MNLFKRHVLFTIFLFLYLFWILFVILWFKTGTSNYPNSCGAANGGLIILTLLVILIYTIVIILKIIFSKTENRIDYLKILGLTIILPILFIIISCII